MNKQIRVKPQPKLFCKAMKKNSIKMILNNIDRGTIDFEPPYQREGNIWPNERKRLFINSILTYYDIPKIYFHRLAINRLVGNDYEYSIIDGKQRLHTIKLFANDELTLDENTVWDNNDEIADVKKMKYSDLVSKYPDIAARFMECELPIINVITDNEDDEIDIISELFLRLNKGMSTNSAEKRNAMVNSDVIKYIKILSKHKFFKEKINISSKRYKHEDIICKFLFFEYCIIEKKIPSTNKNNLDFFTEYFIEHDLDKNIKNNVHKVLNKMTLIFKNKDELLKRQTIIPTYYLLFSIMTKKIDSKSNIRKKMIQFVKNVEENRKIINSLENERASSKVNKELTTYHIESLQGTNRSSSIKKRCTTLAKFMKIDIQDIQTWSSELIFK